MQVIIKIAKNELRNLFYSPVAWFLTIAFLVQCGVFYSTQMEGQARWQQLFLDNNVKFEGFPMSLTLANFLGSDGIFANILRNLYLFIPLLTMGLIGREVSNGTIKLLYSSPVSVRQIVFGKYLAMIVYNIVLVLITGIFVVSALFDIQKADYGMLLSATLGLFLLSSAYTALGMFMSSLSTYQIVTALGTFLVLFLLQRIGGLWQQYDLVRDLTYFLSISGRTTRMLQGLISSSDVIYFIVIILMFVSFTVIKLSAARELKPWYLKAMRYAGVFLLALFIGYTTSRFGNIAYWDTTRNDFNTIDTRTQEMLAKMDGPMEVTLYTNLLGDGNAAGFPAARNNYLWGFWEKYLRFKPDIKFKYVYYYDRDPADSSYFQNYPGKSLEQIAKIMAKGYEEDLSRYITPEAVHKLTDTKAENYRLFMEFNYKGKKTILRTFNDQEFWPNEMAMASNFKRLATDTWPKLGVTAGNLERNVNKLGEREYNIFSKHKGFRESLVNYCYQVDTLLLDKEEIPEDLDILLVADPKTELSQITTGKIRQYIEKGGNVFFLGEAGKQQVLNPVLQSVGLQLQDGTLVEVTRDEMPQMIMAFLTNEVRDLSERPANKIVRVPPPEKYGYVLMAGAVGVGNTDTTGKFARKFLVTTIPSRQTWAKVGKLVTDSAAPVFDPQEGDYKLDSFSTITSLTRLVGNKEQHIVVAGDADFMSRARASGGDFGLDLFTWLSNGEYPLFMHGKPWLDIWLTTSLRRAEIQKIVYIWVLPGIVLLMGTILLIRRKRQ